MSALTDWCEQEEKYLTELIKISQYFSQRYNLTFLQYKRIQNRMRIPQIVLSSAGALISFGSSAFPNYNSEISISVGVSSLIVALIGSIEGLFKVNETITGALQASIDFMKLAESITVELCLPRHKRNSSGLLYVRQSFSLFERITETAPSVYKVVRFVKPYPYNKRGGGPSPLEDPSEELTPISMATFEGKSLENNDTPAGSPAGWRPTQRTAIDLPV